jgi:hypothetical protein
LKKQRKTCGWRYDGYEIYGRRKPTFSKLKNGGIGDIKDQIVLLRKEERHEQQKKCRPKVANAATGVQES